MAAEGFYKWKFTRKYRGFNPDKYKGPTTEILDTVLKTVPPKEDNNGNP